MLTMLVTLLATMQLSVSNPVAAPRKDVAVTVDLPAQTDYRSASVKGAEATPWQLDDMNGDGRADQLVLLLDLAPSETRRLTVELSEAPSEAKFAPRTYAYMRLNDKNQKHPKINAICFPGTTDTKLTYGSIYGHGAVVEGERNAYRVYMDNRQSVDLYSKNTPRLELDETGFYTTREQLAKGYGRDVLWAGNSVALGSFRGWRNEAPALIDTVLTRAQRIVTTGPIRSVIEVTDRAWQINGRKVDMTQRYTMTAGQPGVEVEIRLSPDGAKELYCTGVQKLMTDNVGAISPDGWAWSWGSNLPDKAMPELTDTLGLGIYVPAPYLASVREDELNYLTLLRPDRDGAIRYFFTAGALRTEGNPTSAEAWSKAVEAWKDELCNPVKVKVLKK